MKLIFAQGNPESKYDHTRHNVGFLALDQLATGLKSQWSDKKKFASQIIETEMNGEKVILAKPTTFYNETGVAARKLIDFYNLDPATDFLVIHDDLALPFGTIRTRKQGSDAGNNGIKSLNDHIGPSYHRIRIGTWNELRNRMNDVEFVLSHFSKDEQSHLQSDIIPKVIECIDQFVHGDLQPTSHSVLI